MCHYHHRAIWAVVPNNSTQIQLAFEKIVYVSTTSYNNDKN